MKNIPEEDIVFYKTSKFDIILIVLILFFSIASILWINLGSSQRSWESRAAVVYQGDKILEEVDLEKNRMISLVGGKMQIEVRGGRIRVVNSDCPQKICVNTGWIEHAGQTIVCVPNKVLIEIKSSRPFVDAICY